MARINKSALTKTEIVRVASRMFLEYGLLMTTEDSPPLELRITGALNLIMQLYQVPEQTRKRKIDQVLAMDYRRIGGRIFKEFAAFVEHSSEQAMEDLLLRR